MNFLNRGRHWGTPRHGFVLAALAVVGVLAIALPSGEARAAIVTELATSYTVGIAGATEIDSFTVAGPGTAEVTLTDLVWPQALAGLSFELTNASGQVIGTLSGAGSASIDLAVGGTYFALSFGQASSAKPGALSFGTYGISVVYAPTVVPLPGGALLLLSGLLLLAVLVRGRGIARAAGPLAGGFAATAINV